jgi:glycosyltransferase involved in cell wall biosynthesis
MAIVFKSSNNIQGSIKRKIFFILSSLTSGGSERVFWNLAQGMDKEKFEVAIVILNSKVNCFSTDLDQVRFIDLQTLKASKSFFALYGLLKKEKPYAVFSTTDHINILVALVARFIRATQFIARAANIPSEQILYENFKSKFYALFSKMSYKIFNQIVCQTEDMRLSIMNDYGIEAKKTVVIPNPVLKTKEFKIAKNSSKEFRLVVVARFALEKGLDRLVDILASLPSNYHLSFVGIGVLQDQIIKKVERLNLSSRVKFYGEIKNVQQILAQHDLMVLSSFTEGFPNVVIEAFTVGLPVVAFKVSGVKNIITNGFNGYVVAQNDLTDFKEKIIEACTATAWDFGKIKSDVYEKFDLKKVSKAYEQLIN